MVSLDFKTSWKMFTQRGGVCNGTDIVILNFMLDLLFRMNDKDKQPVIVTSVNDGDFQQVCNDISPVCGNLTK